MNPRKPVKRMTLSLPLTLAERLTLESGRRNVSASALVEALLLFAFEQLLAPQIGEELEKRGASLRRRA